jgi:hypothetical protein
MLDNRLQVIGYEKKAFNTPAPELFSFLITDDLSLVI